MKLPGGSNRVQDNGDGEYGCVLWGGFREFDHGVLGKGREDSHNMHQYVPGFACMHSISDSRSYRIKRS